MSALTALPRRAGPVVLVCAALLFGALSVGYAWIVARHLRNDARETSRLLGQVFAGLNDPREGAAADALLTLADEVRRLGIPLAVTDTAGRITALDNEPFDDTAGESTRRATEAAIAYDETDVLAAFAQRQIHIVNRFEGEWAQLPIHSQDILVGQKI